MKIELIEYTPIRGDKWVEAYVKVKCNDKFFCTLKVIRNKEQNLIAVIPSVKIHDKWVKIFDFSDTALTNELQKECTAIAHREHPKSSGGPSVFDNDMENNLPF